MSNIPQYLNTFLLILSLCLALYSGVKHKVWPFLASVACFLNDSVLSSFMSLTTEILSFGLVWPMIGLAGILTLLFFKIPRRIGASGYPHNNIIQIAIVVSITYCLLSLPLFLFPMQSLRVILSFILSIYVGWKLLGGLLSKNPATIYKNILTILYANAFIAALNIVLTLMLFKSANPSFSLNPLRTGLFFLENPTGRIQVYLNALALAYGLIFVILIGVNWIVSSKSLSTRFLLVGVTSYLCLILLNSGSRGPILALCIILFVFLARMLLSKAYSPHIRFISGIVLALVLTLSAVNWYSHIRPLLVARSLDSSTRDIGLVEVLMNSRILISKSIYDEANQMGYNIFLGAGPGADQKISESLQSFHSAIESFFLGMFFKWGAIGGFFFILGMAALSYQVIKMERIERALGNKHAWLATVWILVPWITSPFEYGFGIPGGGLCITFAIGAGALTYCESYAAFSKQIWSEPLRLDR